jgi:hypothetical protein
VFSTLAAFERMVTPRQPNASILNNFLLMQYSDSREDAINATPLIAALHASVAAANPAIDVFDGIPGMRKLIATPSPQQNFRGAIQALRSAKPFGREHFATLFTIGNESSRNLFAAMLSSHSSRIGFTETPELVTILLRYDDRISPVANNLSIIAALGHSAALLEALRSDPELIEPRSYPTT